MKKTTALWVNKAENDFQYARSASPTSGSFHDQRCFLCQQSAEKYLKALLEELGQPIPRTHILRDLLGLLIPFHPQLRSLGRGLKFLTRFAVGIRYPGDNATKRQALAAVGWAERVRRECRTLLRIKPPRKKTK